MEIDVRLIIGCLTQIICLVIGIQVLGRFKFSWLFTIILLAMMAVIAIPMYAFYTYISVIYMIAISIWALNRGIKNIKLSLLFTIVTFIIMVIVDYLVSLTLMILPNMEFHTIEAGEPQANLIFLLYFCIIISLVDIVLKRIGGKVVFKNRYLILTLVISILTLVMFYFYIWQGKEQGFSDTAITTNAVAFLVYTVIMIVVLAIIVKSSVKNAKVEAQALQMRQLREYVGALEALQKDMRVFRHDYVNILSGINGFITNSDMDGLSVYFRTKVIPMNSDMEVNISKLSTLQNLEVIELKGLFATKMIRAQELGVDAQVEVYKRIDEMNMDSIDLCRVTGILLDNAIEAVVDTADPTVRVAIIQKKEAIVLIFANSLPEDSPPIHQFFEEGFSTKGENRGIGLSTLKKTLKKYPNVSLDTKITQHGFVQELEIG